MCLKRPLFLVMTLVLLAIACAQGVPEPGSTDMKATVDAAVRQTQAVAAQLTQTATVNFEPIILTDTKFALPVDWIYINFSGKDADEIFMATTQETASLLSENSVAYIDELKSQGIKLVAKHEQSVLIIRKVLFNAAVNINESLPVSANVMEKSFGSGSVKYQVLNINGLTVGELIFPMKNGTEIDLANHTTVSYWVHLEKKMIYDISFTIQAESQADFEKNYAIFQQIMRRVEYLP